MKAPRQLGLLLLVTLFSAFLLSCEDDDVDKLAKAQKCLNSADSASDAESCKQHLSGLDSQQANIIRCSLEMMIGGISTTTFINAFKELEDNEAAEKELFLIAALTQSTVDQAATSFSACKKSNVESLIYIAGLSQVGTNLALGAGLNLSDPNFPTQAQVDEIITDCQASPSTCGASVIVDNLETISAGYCSGAKKDDDVCQEIEQSLGSGDANTILTNFLNNLNDTSS